MAQYDITSPDGKKFRITAPEGATQEQVLAYAQKNFQAEPAKEAVKPAQVDPSKMSSQELNGWLKENSWGTGFGPAMHELGGKVTDLTGSPVLGGITNFIGNAIPAAITSGRVANPEAVPVLEKAAKGLMHSAIKPASKDIVSGDAAKAIDTMLKEGANVSSSGVAKLRGLVDKLHGEVAQKIEAAAKSGTTVDKSYVGSELYKTLQKFRNQLNSGADEAAILKSWQETSQKLAAKIPVDQAQSLKQGTYKILADKYAKIGAVENEAATQAQMAGARGLRKGIEDAVPGVGPLNARESSVINAIEMAERRAGIGGNKDVGGIAWLANNPAAAAAMMADRSAAFKSWLANKIFQVRNAVPAAMRGGALPAASALEQEKESP